MHTLPALAITRPEKQLLDCEKCAENIRWTRCWKDKQNYRLHTSLLWCSAARDSSTNHDKFHCCRILTRRTFSWQNRVDRKPTRHSVQYTGHTAYHCVCVMTDRRPRDCAILISMANINDNYPSICQRIMLLSKICIKQSWTIIDICITYTSDRYIW